MAVKSKVVDTSAINPTEFLAGAPDAPVPAVAAPAAETATPPEPAASPIPTAPPADAKTDEPAAPNRPGLETPATPAPAPAGDPFVLIQSWQGTHTTRALRAMPVPGGCIMRLSSVTGNVLVESICFVPGMGPVEGKTKGTAPE